MRCWSLAVMLAVGCGDTTSPTALTIDVVVADDSVRVFAREVERPCRCTTGELPAIGACERLLDVVGCSCDAPPPASCLSAVRIEDGGTLVAEVAWTEMLAERGVVELDAAVRGLTSPELIVEGCGATHRAPLRTGAAPAATLRELSYDEATLTVSGDAAAGTTTVLGSFDYHVGSTDCRAEPTGSLDIPAPYSFEYGQSTVWLWAFVTSEHGSVRVHDAGSTSVDNVFLPNQLDDGRWILPPFVATAPTVTLAIDGEAAFTEVVAPSFGAADLSVAEPLIELMGSGQTRIGSFRYVGAATDDTLTITLDGVLYSGTFAHAAPTDGLEVGVPVPDRVAFDLGPVTLTRDGVPAETVSATGEFVWDLGVVARPIE